MTSRNKKRPPNLAQVVDRLGEVRAEIEQGKAREKELRDVLEQSGETEITGKRYKATVSRFERRKIDYRGLLAKLAPSPRVLRRFTTILKDQARVTTKPLPRSD